MWEYKVVVEPHGKKWRWTVQGKPSPMGRWKVVCLDWMNRDYLEGKARTFEKAAHAATAALGRVYAEEHRKKLVRRYRESGTVEIHGA